MYFFQNRKQNKDRNPSVKFDDSKSSLRALRSLR